MIELARAEEGREISKNGGRPRGKNWKSHNISLRALRRVISTRGGHSGSFFINPECMASIRVVVLVFTANKQTEL